MHDLLDKYLCKKYPKIFVNRDKAPNVSCMSEGFSCGDGWFHLIDRMCYDIQFHIDHPDFVLDIPNALKLLYTKTVWNKIIYPLIIQLPFPTFEKLRDVLLPDVRYERPDPSSCKQVVALQVKEKFAALRFYYDGGDEYVRGVVSFAETLSYKICETCGRMDSTVTQNREGWIQTACEDCRKPGKSKEYLTNLKHDKELQDIWKKVKKDYARKPKNSGR